MHARPSAPHTEALEDPRVRRSRAMLHDALASLLRVKDFEKISIADIAEAAALNRATFYDHYPDKSALLTCMVATRFRERMEARSVCFSDCTEGLRSVALGVCEFLAEMPRRRAGSHEGSVQAAVLNVVRRMVEYGLAGFAVAPSLSRDVLVSTVAWALYGGADGWLLSVERPPADEAATMIAALVVTMLHAAEGSKGASAACGESPVH